MNDPLTPKRPLAPALPMAVPQTDAAVASKPLGTGHIPTQDGDTLLVDRGRFDSLAHRDDVPGAAGVPEVKFLILGIDGEDPQLYFINSTSYQYHFDFAKQVLGSTLTSAISIGSPTSRTTERTWLGRSLRMIVSPMPCIPKVSSPWNYGRPTPFRHRSLSVPGS